MSQPIKPRNLRFAILAVDVAVIAVMDNAAQVLLMPVHLPPEIVEAQALPGGLIRPDETAEQAVGRHLREKCGLSGCYCEQLATFSKVDRDPRGRVVSVAYLALISHDAARTHPLPDGLAWRDIGKVGRLAYDHNEILKVAIGRLQVKLQSTTIARHLIGKTFTLSELQKLYEIVFGWTLDKRNFRKKLMASAIVRPTGKKLHLPAGRPSELYRFAGSKTEVIGMLAGS